MKKLFSLIAAIIIISCSTNSDDNGNSTTAVVPVPPTNLLGTVASPTQINLSWTDNSTNETGFKIDRKVGSGNWVTDYGIVSNADVINYSDTSVSAGNTYTYRVSSFNSVGKSLTYSNEVTLSPTAAPVLPTLTTTAASSIAATTAASGGTISSDGGAAITVRGICWSTSPNPTIVLTTKTTDGTGIGAFTSNITGLTANTSYYIKAYATNSQGTAYGNEISFTTLQNANVVPLPNVTIGTQIWSSTNLDVTTYRDGTPIPQVTDPTAWAGLTTGAWCYYNNTTANGITYGKLYNWYAVAGIHDTDPSTPNKILAPQGWHVPSDAEWTTLTDFLGGGQVAGGKMKSTGTSLWSSPNTAATNESGFSGLPGGCRGNLGSFNFFGGYGFWWSSSESSTADAWYRYLYYSAGLAVRDDGNNKGSGFSVRCLRD
jgi:uncharacterized protein (TIGR02145 family)